MNEHLRLDVVVLLKPIECVPDEIDISRTVLGQILRSQKRHLCPVGSRDVDDLRTVGGYDYAIDAPAAAGGHNRVGDQGMPRKKPDILLRHSFRAAPGGYDGVDLFKSQRMNPLSI